MIPGTPQEQPSNKKIKIGTVKQKEKAIPNRSRLLQICDSSSDEDEPKTVDKNIKPKTENKSENGHDDVDGLNDIVMKENKTPPKETNIKTEAEVKDAPKRRKYKTKRMVKRTYEDDEGYIRKFSYHVVRILYLITIG